MSTKISDYGTVWLVTQIYARPGGKRRERGAVEVEKGDKDALKKEVMRQCAATRQILQVGGST